METAILLLVLLNLILTGAGLVLLVLERRDVLLQKEPEPKPESVLRVDPDKYMEPATVTNIKPVPIRPRPPFGPPMVGEETLKSWLIHLYNNDGVWSRFVEDFYVRAMTNHLVRPYFEGKDTQEIQKKFLATLLILTDKGVSEAAAATLVQRHMHLGITEAAYDATMEALEVTLEAYRVPEATIRQFLPMIDFFRDEMVTE